MVVAVLCVAVHCHPLDDSDVAASGGKKNLFMSLLQFTFGKLRPPPRAGANKSLPWALGARALRAVGILGKATPR